MGYLTGSFNLRIRIRIGKSVSLELHYRQPTTVTESGGVTTVTPCDPTSGCRFGPGAPRRRKVLDDHGMNRLL